MTTIYMKVTIPELPEAVRVSFNSVMQTKATPEATLKFVRSQAAKRGVNATYELATREEYYAFRKAQKGAIEAHAAAQS
jgi:hypothetical protein